eukprot:Gregarina_sp_Pseudo_9__623@NODE_139_length_4007_cov_184_780242_g128_i0_p4_GENE_NODE_139_length_4007_cov_184_780242_g128_i0NODE_139_length_4007_cov_184_780242_g128_i0_p4_ORF_typecomplete_len117_score7_17Innexin/PF00876_18/0_022_NODE_139_length_4007_cov_184_780242_g128_i033713721
MVSRFAGLVPSSSTSYDRLRSKYLDARTHTNDYTNEGRSSRVLHAWQGFLVRSSRKKKGGRRPLLLLLIRRCSPLVMLVVMAMFLLSFLRNISFEFAWGVNVIHLMIMGNKWTIRV